MPKDSGIAFVLVPHLDPTHKSLMVELLSKQTEMTVSEAEEGMVVEPDHVYIIPPNRYLSLEQGRFKLEIPPESRPMAIAIDGFFRSLAADQGDRAIGIILSGTGSHGVTGLREIKLAGGMVMAQRPDTADFDQMPSAAIAAGLVDSSLPPEEMPRAIVEFVKLFYRNRRPEPDSESELEEDIEAQMAPILALLRSQTKADFRHYRKNMLLRRILRRMGLRQIERVADYRELLLRDSAEVSALYKDMLIGVTNFFREAETFDVIEQRHSRTRRAERQHTGAGLDSRLLDRRGSLFPGDAADRGPHRGEASTARANLCDRHRRGILERRTARHLFRKHCRRRFAAAIATVFHQNGRSSLSSDETTSRNDPIRVAKPDFRPALLQTRYPELPQSVDLSLARDAAESHSSVSLCLEGRRNAGVGPVGIGRTHDRSVRADLTQMASISSDRQIATRTGGNPDSSGFSFAGVFLARNWHRGHRRDCPS